MPNYNAWWISILFLLVPTVYAQEEPAIPIGSHSVPVNERVTTQKPLTLNEEGATFVKVYFEPLGQAEITVSAADGVESYTYSPTLMDKHTRHGDQWAALSVDGDTAIVEVKHGSVMVTHVDYGLAEPIVPETTCGADNKRWIACFDGAVRDRARPVARISMEGGGLCTAWRVGPGNMMITNNHCAGDASRITGAEIWFDYEYTDCNATSIKSPFKVPGGAFLKTSRPYDYTLFTVDATPAELAPFGWFGLEPRQATKGEEIYIIGHPDAVRKKGIVESDLNDSGHCEIDVASRSGFTANSDYGYWCDSEGGQSGSPVMTQTNHRAIALHHFGGCINAGVKVANIWPEIAEFFDGIPPVGDNETPGPAVVAAITFDCVDNICQYSAEGSTPGASYRWDFADGTFSDTFSGEKVYTLPDYYTVRLYVTLDGSTNTTAKTVLVHVPGYNFPPVSRFEYSIDRLTVHFKSTSYDPEGTALTYSWRVRDPLDGIFHYYNLPEFDHTYVGPGEGKYADLHVIDADGVRAKYTFYQNITIPVPPPICGDGRCETGETYASCPADCPAPPPPITLTYSGQRAQGPNWDITFKWTGAVGDTVKLYRASTPTTTANDGIEVLRMHNKEKGARFKVCDDLQCSRAVSVVW